MAERPRARRGEGDQLAEEIVTVADALLRQAGHADGVSINDIVRAVGCTPPALYLHFPSKQAVFIAVCERHFAGFRQALDEAAGEESDPLLALGARGKAYLRWALANPETYRIVFMHRAEDVPDGAVREQSDGALSDQTEAVRRCIDAGHFPDADPVVVGMALWASVHGLASLLISKPQHDWPDLDAMIDAVIYAHGLGIDSMFKIQAATAPRRAGSKRARAKHTERAAR